MKGNCRVLDIERLWLIVLFCDEWVVVNDLIEVWLYWKILSIY